MDLQKMLRQAQELQTRMADMQKKLEGDEEEGSSGGGMVKVRVNGKGQALKIMIDSKLMDPNEKEMLEDLVVAAFNDARGRMDAHFSSEMNRLTQGMPLPPGFKMPT